MRYLLAITLLTLIYLFTLASFQLWDVVIGVALAVFVLWLFRSFLGGSEAGGEHSHGPSLPARIAAFPLFCAVVAWDIVIGTWYMAKIVLRLEPIGQPGIVPVPIGDRTRIGVVVSSIATTLSPGTLLIDIDWEAGVMLIHAIDAGDPERIKANHQRFYDRYHRRVFP